MTIQELFASIDNIGSVAVVETMLSVQTKQLGISYPLMLSIIEFWAATLKTSPFWVCKP